jgi:flagellar motility protein MotE (MotC chaperone)
MNSLRERGIVRPFLVLLLLFLVLKGWLLLSMIHRGEGETCLAEPVSAAQAGGQSGPESEEAVCDERVAGLLRQIQDEETRLAEKAMGLEEREKRLQIYSQELSDKISNLNMLRKKVETIHQQIKEYEDEKQQRLVKIYDAMEPENAAQRLEAMDDALGSWLLLRINVRKAGQILGALTPEKASRITKRLRGEDPQSAKQIEEALKSSRKTAASLSETEVPSQEQPKSASTPIQRDPSKERLLQIGTFSEPERAERVVTALKEKGYASFQKEWTRGAPPKAYYKVFVGPFPDVKEASATKAQLEQSEGYRGILIRKGA